MSNSRCFVNQESLDNLAALLSDFTGVSPNTPPPPCALFYGRPIGPPKVGGEEVIPYRKRRSTYD